MKFRIPVDLETTIRAAVQGGRFASVDEAMTEAARMLVRELTSEPADAPEPANPLLGLWHDYADEMDKIVAEAYRQRQTDTWRDIDVE